MKYSTRLHDLLIGQVHYLIIFFSKSKFLCDYFDHITHLSRMVRYTQKNELAKPHINYESRTIMWYKTPNFQWKKQADFEKTHISVILYYKIDHFCPLKTNFHPFSIIWTNIWVWDSLLPSCYHLLVQVRHVRSHFFPYWHQ